MLILIMVLTILDDTWIRTNISFTLSPAKVQISLVCSYAKLDVY